LSNATIPEPIYFGREKSRTTRDKVFTASVIASAFVSLLVLAAIMIYLATTSWSVLKVQGLDFIFGSTWNHDPDVQIYQIWPMLYGSLLNGILALIVAVPVSVLLAIFIVFIAPKQLSKTLTIIVDVLAAIPSGIIGLWGFLVFTNAAAEWAELLNRYLGWIPIFSNETEQFARSPFIAGWVLAIMITPIITVVAREILAQTPAELMNAAYGLGSSTWSAIKTVAIPYARGGIIGGVMLGLGRALGETIAIYFVLNLIFERVNYYEILEPEGGAVASLIVAKFGDAYPDEVRALLGAGLVLFILTLIVNMIANAIVARYTQERLV
jgi:phosphate transport system permease protein